MSNELPDHLIDGKDIDIVVHEDYIKEFEQFMLSHILKNRFNLWGERTDGILHINCLSISFGS